MTRNWAVVISGAALAAALAAYHWPALAKLVESRAYDRVLREQEKSGIKKEEEACGQALQEAARLKKGCKSDSDCAVVYARCGCISINKDSVSEFKRSLNEKCTRPAICRAMVDPLCEKNTSPTCDQGLCGPKGAFESIR